MREATFTNLPQKHPSRSHAPMLRFQMVKSVGPFWANAWVQFSRPKLTGTPELALVKKRRRLKPMTGRSYTEVPVGVVKTASVNARKTAVETSAQVPLT
jgi:hypothetical protein